MLPGLLLRHVCRRVRELNRLFLLLLVGCSGGGGADAGPDATASDAPSGDGYVAPILDACSPIEGGAACNAGAVPCGTKSCTAGTQFCCINDGGTTCDPVEGGMPPPMGGYCAGATKAYCYEAANCPNNELCCGFVGTGGGYATTCQPTCSGNAVQFCHGSAECGSNGPCVGQMCNGVFVETCGGLLECP